LAIEELLVTDKLFKSANMKERKMYVNLIESVREHGGRVFVFSCMHVSGAQLDMYTGIAATLRFPLPPIEQFDDDAQSTSSDEATVEKYKDN
jgi:protein pelota